MLSVSKEHIALLLMLWHLGFGNYTLLRRTLPRNKYTNDSWMPVASFLSVLFSHIHLLSLLVFIFFLLPSFSLFLSEFLCFLRLRYVTFLVCGVVCLFLSFSSFITQKCNSAESYKIWNVS
jgi:hypothetical protein